MKSITDTLLISIDLSASEFKDYSRMEIAGGKVEFEKNLDNMWTIYTKGNP